MSTPMSDYDIFSSYNVRQTSNEDKEKYHLALYQLIQYYIYPSWHHKNYKAGNKVINDCHTKSRAVYV